MLKVQIVAPLLAIDGYGYAAENMTLALKKIGIDVSFFAQDWAIDKFSKKELLDLRIQDKAKLDRKVPTVIFHLPPTLAAYQDFKHKIAFTMFETSKVPEGWVNCLNTLCDLVIVPSEFCKRTFIASGVKKHIEVVPLGIDLNNYAEVKRPDREPFTFLTLANMDERKNFALALAAFYEQFKGDKSTRLVIKTRKGSPVNFIPCKNIEIIEDDYTAAQMRDLYASADCFIYPSRGEGFGLPPREAMATGLPVILTGWSALEDIAFERMAYPLKDYKLIPAVYPKSQILGLGDNLGKWADPAKEELKEKMLYVRNNLSEAKKKGALAAGVMRIEAEPTVGARELKKAVKALKYRKVIHSIEG